MSRRGFALSLLIIAAIALSWRVTYILTVTRHQDTPSTFNAKGTRNSWDELYYRNGAEALVNGDGFKFPEVFGLAHEQAQHPPLTNLALAPAAWIAKRAGWSADTTSLAMRFTVALGGVAVVVLAGLLGREILGPRAGLIAAGLAAVYPNLWVNDGLIMSETFATLGVAATTYWTYRMISGRTMAAAALAGLMCGLAALARSELLLLVPMMLIPAALRIPRLERSRRLQLAGVAVLAAGLTVAPWIAYNATRFDQTVTLSYGDGGVFAGANCDVTYHGRELGSWIGMCYPNPSPTLGEPAYFAQQARKAGLHYMRHHLSRLPVVVAARVGREWSIFRPSQMVDGGSGEGRPRWASWSGWGMLLVLVASGAAGTWILARRRMPLIPLLAPIVTLTAVAAFFYGGARFRAPVEISVLLLATVAIDGLIATAGRSRNTSDVPEPRRGQGGAEATKSGVMATTRMATTRSFC